MISGASCCATTSYSSHLSCHHRDLHSFPTRRSSDLALLDHAELIELAKQNRGQIVVPTGALIGLDAVTAAAVGHIHSVRMVTRSEEHTSELQSRENLVCRLLLEKKNRATSTLQGSVA